MEDFRSTLTARARARPCTVALPEPHDTRVLQAAVRAQEDGIANCMLLGEAAEVQRAAAAANISLPESLRIVQVDVADYAPALVTLREKQGKAMDLAAAQAMLGNPAAQTAMLVSSGEADAMVAGAAMASADVLRPVLQIIGLRPGETLASSAFLMCFPDGMKVFADCALNIAPEPPQLAAIAEQSAATARVFGLQPVVAMLSFASGGGNNHALVAKVEEAAALLRQKCPDLPVTAPVQYDAAISPEVAAHKCPQDPAAGRANVLIFPDLQTGNITYKAVQHAGKLTSIGPLLQGLAAPANDLSRGATAEDIYYTIAATAAQAAVDGGMES